MTKIEVETILRSRNAECPEHVLSTMIWTFPRVILPEVLTHCALSRNTSSSRAIPFKRMRDEAIRRPFVPLVWTKNQKGMQGYTHLTGGRKLAAAAAWHAARGAAVVFATVLNMTGVHKQVVNRLLEPFLHVRMVVSATEWENFLALRDHPAAEPHMQMLARAVKAALARTDDIQDLAYGDWHIPFASKGQLLDISVACCASVSYSTVEGLAMSEDRAERIYNTLLNEKHASPFEHQATALKEGEASGGKFKGFRQFRHIVGM